MSKTKIFLSPPHMGSEELRFVHEAFESNYIAPLGPQVNAFEKEFSDHAGIKHCVGLSSGTGAMHLALRDIGVGSGPQRNRPQVNKRPKRVPVKRKDQKRFNWINLTG